MHTKIFVFTEQVRANPFLEALQAQFGKASLMVFSALGDCVMEALDHGPRLVIFDIPMATSAVLIQIGRIRTDRLHGGLAVIVRAQRLDETALARLYELEVNDVLLTLLPMPKGLERIRLVYDDPQSEAVKQTRLKLGEGLMTRGTGVETTVISPKMLESFRQQYSLDFTASATRGTWGLVPLGPQAFALFCADFQGEEMTIAAQGNRLHAMVRAEGYDRTDPQAATSFLAQSLSGFLKADQTGVLIYAVFDLKEGRFRACVAGPGAMLHGQAGAVGFSPLPRTRHALSSAPLSAASLSACEVDSARFATGDIIVLECAAHRLGMDAIARTRMQDWRTRLIEDARQTPIDDLSSDLLFSLIGARRNANEALSPLLVIKRN